MVITERTVQEIVAYVLEQDRSVVAPDSRVLVASRTRPGLTGESTVLRVGEGIQPVPPRLWNDSHLSYDLG